MIPTSPEAELRALGSLRRQCLFAVTILLVEDSRSASEAIRLYAAESGARVRRADSLHAASRHLAIYRPNVVMVDLGLPDGDGMALIRHLASASTPLGAIVALSGHERGAWQAEAIEAGAAACLEKPIASLRAFQECVLSVLPDAETRRGPDDARARARPAAPRSAPRSPRTCAAPARSSPRRCRPATSRPSPTARSSSARSARCSATRDLAAPPAAPAAPGGAGPLAALLERRLGVAAPGRQVA